MLEKSVFITGGAGYCGSLLVPYLLEKGFKVTVYDIMYFSDAFLPLKNDKLTVIKGDIRDTAKLKKSCQNHVPLAADWGGRSQRATCPPKPYGSSDGAAALAA